MTCTWPSVHRLNIPASPEETNARDHTSFVLSDGLSLSCISIFSFFFPQIFMHYTLCLKNHNFAVTKNGSKIMYAYNTARYAYNVDAYIGGSL
jgi:hypothetical protein